MIIDYKLLGKRIKDARKLAKITQEQSAEYLDVSVSYISQVERGITKISLDTLAKYIGFIDADMATVITGVATVDKQYLFDEIDLGVIDLVPKERKMLFDFIVLIKNNR